MSLTKEAYHERQWGSFPELAKLLDKKQLSAEWTGLSSVSDNIFDKVHRFLRIFALVHDSESLVEQALMEIGDPVGEELHTLSRALTWASEVFEEASKQVSQLAHRGR